MSAAVLSRKADTPFQYACFHLVSSAANMLPCYSQMDKINSNISETDPADLHSAEEHDTVLKQYAGYHADERI